MKTKKQVKNNYTNKINKYNSTLVEVEERGEFVFINFHSCLFISHIHTTGATCTATFNATCNVTSVDGRCVLQLMLHLVGAVGFCCALKGTFGCSVDGN